MDRKYLDCLHMRNNLQKHRTITQTSKREVCWKWIALDKIATFSKGQGFSKSDLSKTGMPILLYGNLYTDYHLIIDNVETLTKSQAPAIISKGKEVIVPSSGETAEDIARASVILREGIIIGGDINIIHPSDKINPIYLSIVLSYAQPHYELVKKAQGIGIVHLNINDLASVKIPITSTAEQERIAQCIISIDNQIEKNKVSLEALKKHKASLMQQLFPQRGSDTPVLRFTDKNTRWKYKSLKAKTIHCTKKNVDNTVNTVLTNSAQYGVICQQEYFERDIVSQYNLKNYYVVEKGDYVYNPRVSIAAPVGPVSKNKISRGVISPLYLVFRFNHEIDDFYVYYFQSLHWQIHLKRIANSGARFDRMSISTSDFFEIKVPDLPAKESIKIASTLTSLDNLIDAYQKKYDLLIKHKSGLIQQLFSN